MHNSLNERFFSFNSTVVIFRNLFRNDSGIIMEKDRNLLSFGVWSGGGLSSIHLAILKGKHQKCSSEVPHNFYAIQFNARSRNLKIFEGFLKVPTHP